MHVFFVCRDSNKAAAISEIATYSGLTVAFNARYVEPPNTSTTHWGACVSYEAADFSHFDILPTKAVYVTFDQITNPNAPFDLLVSLGILTVTQNKATGDYIYDGS